MAFSHKNVNTWGGGEGIGHWFGMVDFPNFSFLKFFFLIFFVFLFLLKNNIYLCNRLLYFGLNLVFSDFVFAL